MLSVEFFVILHLLFKLILFTSQIVITKTVTDFVFFGGKFVRFKTVFSTVETNVLAVCESSINTRTFWDAFWVTWSTHFNLTVGIMTTSSFAILINLHRTSESSHTAFFLWTFYMAHCPTTSIDVVGFTTGALAIFL